MAGGLWFEIRRSGYRIGVNYQTIAALTSAIGGAVKNGDEVYEGVSQGRFGVIASNTVVLTTF